MSNQDDDWSAKQGRILTGAGRLNELFRGPDYPFAESDLPHHHLLRGESRQTFRAWRRNGESNEMVAGAWTRPLFVGGWEHTDNVRGERVFNLQTGSIFIDIRIPIGFGPDLSTRASLQELTDAELRLFARRHAFAGFSRIEGSVATPVASPPVCVRHHAIDWNFVGGPRPRPNKWRIEHEGGQPGSDVWKEWGWPKDEHGQHVYMERWERLPGGGAGPCIALRRLAGLDAFIVVVGDHFNYIQNRPTPYPRDERFATVPGLTSLVESLGKLGSSGRPTLEHYLSLEACHGRVADSWTIDAALHPWQEGTRLLVPGDVVMQSADRVLLKGEPWEILECTCSLAEAAQLLQACPSKL